MVPVCRHARHWRTYLAGGGLILGLGCGATTGAPKVTQSKPPAPGISAANKPPQQPAAQEADSARTYQGGSLAAPFIVKVLPTPKTQEEAANDKDDRDEKTSADWWMIRLTGFLGLIGIGQGIIFWLQALRLGRTIKTMENIARGQDSINATVNRPFMVISDYSPHVISDNVNSMEKTWTILVTAKNVGNTPTRRIRGYVKYLVSNSPDISDKFDFKNEDEVVYWPDIGGGETRFLEFEAFPLGLWGNYVSRVTHLFVYGAIEYSSVFHGERRFRTEFCVRLHAAGDIRANGPGTYFISCGPHNGTDENAHLAPLLTGQ